MKLLLIFDIYCVSVVGGKDMVSVHEMITDDGRIITELAAYMIHIIPCDILSKTAL